MTTHDRILRWLASTELPQPARDELIDLVTEIEVERDVWRDAAKHYELLRLTA